MKVRSFLILLVINLAACEAQEPPKGMPRCEPEGELVIERDLKTGFRHLFEGDSQKAREVFKTLLAQEKDHPEALLGMKHANGMAMQRGTKHSESRLIVANRLIPAPMPVNSERYRYEFEWNGQQVRDRVGKEKVTTRKRPYAARRDKQGATIASDDLAHLQRSVDTVVFQDSETVTAAEFFYASAITNISTHFLIDSDGRIFQTLDLALEAHDSGLESVSRRSISVTVVNPVVTATKPLEERARSAPLERHGGKVVHWGYTPSQRRSLKQLVAGLLALLPNLKLEIPEDDIGRVLTSAVPKPEEAKGLLGSFHLDSNVNNPTVAFPWMELKRYLSTSLEP